MERAPALSLSDKLQVTPCPIGYGCLMSGLNLLHILVVLSAGACLYYALREAPHRTVKLKRLFWAPWAGSVAALLLVFFQIGTKQPPWPFAGALALGLAGGGVRGATLKLSIDEYWLVVRPAGSRVLLWIGAAVAAAAVVEIVGAMAGPAGDVPQFVAALVAVGSVGALFGRALAVSARVLWMHK